MKILHATKRYPNSAGGDATVVKSLERIQRKTGDDIVILTSNCPDIVDAAHVQKFGLKIVSHDIDTINLRRIISLAMLFVSSFWRLRKIRPDIIHSHSMDLGFFIRPAARLYRIPIINTCHGTSIGKTDFSKFKQGLELFFLKHGRFYKIITVDEPSLKSFKKHGLNNVVYVPNGVDEFKAEVRPKKTGGKTVLMFVGRLESVKGVSDLLKAFSTLRNRQSLELWLVGNGSDVEKLKTKAKELGIDEQTKFLGRQKPAKTRKLFAQADIFVLPSHYEGFPIVMLEAWATSLPVVVSRVGAMQTVCHDGIDSLLIRPKQPKQLAAALERLIGDKKLQKKLGTNGRKLVETMYNYPSINERIEAIYAEVVK